ncbi:T9SS type A sorting domain-containing protein [Dyadobacter sp. 676]|uniref:T9SS type A sorting domain-containing protein n=1 Tax=Dyadobacter sp. 676 TaxID=3088362 RepID=A0AAU8FJ14_9BACT
MKLSFTYLAGLVTGRRAYVVILSSLLAHSTFAQQGSTGNTYIFGGAQMTFFGNHDFANGGAGALPGIIGTERTGTPGILNFAPSASHNGGADAAHVDGFVRKYGTTLFVFPVGDNGFYGPFAAQGDGTTGAYYHADASTAITSNLAGGDYPILPAGGPYPTSSFEEALTSVSPVEYWDIDGDNATPITLTWDAASDVTTLTTGQLDKLTIAGWNGTQWLAIPSVVDATSILGGASDLTAGSITTQSPVIPSTYTIYTLAYRDVPLPVTLASFDALREGNAVALKWATTEEMNAARFEVERSLNGKSWDKIGDVAARGESTVRVEYSFVDIQPAEGENLYRLKMIDLDGTFAYSRVRNVRVDGSTPELSVYPNPVTDKLHVKESRTVKEVTMFNTKGLKVYHSKGLGGGAIDVTSLPTGIYAVHITRNGGITSVQKILVNR